MHIANTVKPVYNSYSRDPVLVVFVDRWSLYRGALVSPRWPMEHPTVVTIDRWSVYRGALVSPRWPMEQPTVVSVRRQVVLLYKWSLRQVSLYILKVVVTGYKNITHTYMHMC